MIESASVLLVEDDQELNELLSEFLILEGFQVKSVFDGAVGLTEAKTNHYDVIVLDIMLPKLNGL